MTSISAVSPASRAATPGADTPISGIRRAREVHDDCRRVAGRVQQGGDAVAVVELHPTCGMKPDRYIETVESGCGEGRPAGGCGSDKASSVNLETPADVDLAANSSPIGSPTERRVRQDRTHRV